MPSDAVRHFTNKFLSSRQTILQANVQELVPDRPAAGGKILPESKLNEVCNAEIAG
jgi:hypothetical protein